MQPLKEKYSSKHCPISSRHTMKATHTQRQMHTGWRWPCPDGMQGSIPWQRAGVIAEDVKCEPACCPGSINLSLLLSQESSCSLSLSPLSVSISSPHLCSTILVFIQINLHFLFRIFFFNLTLFLKRKERMNISEYFELELQNTLQEHI